MGYGPIPAELFIDSRRFREQLPCPVTLHVEVDGVYKKATLTLRHDHGEVVLKKAVVEIYREN